MKASINGFEMAFEDAGSGPSVVLLHGFALNRQMWRKQVGPLVGSGFRVITPDLRGFGESGAPVGSYTMSDFADDTIGLLDYLGVGRAVVCGMSLGGYILFELLSRYPARLAGACFVVSQARGDSCLEGGRRVDAAQLLENGRTRLAMDGLAPLYFAPENLEGQPALLSEVRHWLAANSPAVLAEVLMGMRVREDYTQKITSFTLPTLVVGAASDQIVSPEQSKNLANSLPHCVCQILPNSGHLVNMERPAEFNGCLVSFLRRLRGVLLKKGIPETVCD